MKEYVEGQVYIDRDEKIPFVLYVTNFGEELLRDVDTFSPIEIVQYVLKTNNDTILGFLTKNQKVDNYYDVYAIYKLIKNLPVKAFNKLSEKVGLIPFYDEIAEYAQKHNLRNQPKYPENVMEKFAQEEYNKIISKLKKQDLLLANPNTQLITKEIIKKGSPFNFCGKYDGRFFNVFTGKTYEFTPEETAFGVFCYVLRFLTHEVEKQLGHPHDGLLQEDIELAMESLEIKAMKYIDKERKQVIYDANEIKENSKVKEIAGLMPYVIQYFAAKNNLFFDDNQVLVNGKYSPHKSIFTMPLKTKDALKDQDLILGICQKTAADVKKYLPADTLILS